MKYNKTRSRVLLLVLAACFGTFLASSPFAIVSGGKENVSRILGPAGVVLREYETFTFGAIARLSDPVPQDIRTIQTLWALGQMTPRDVRCALAIKWSEFLNASPSKQGEMFGKVAVPAVLALGNPGGRVAAVEGVGATAVKTVGTAEKVAAEFAEATVSKGAEAAAEIRSAAQEVKLLGTARDNLLHAAQNPRLRDAINNLYRPGSKLGSGSSMDALRIEGSHLEKVLGRRTQLQRIVNEETLNATERKIARDLLIDIQDALSKHIGAP